MKFTNFVEIDRMELENCFNEELDRIYKPWSPFPNGIKFSIKASDCFKKLTPKLYEELFIEFCLENGIMILKDPLTKRFIFLDIETYTE